jgi:hypothetical protein
VLLAVLVTAVGAVATCVAAWRRQLTVFVLCAWLLAPFAAIMLISLFQSVFLDRVFLDATFPLYLLIGIGVTRLPSHPLRAAPAAALALTVCIASFSTLRPVYAQSVNPDWATAMRDFQSAYRAGEAVAYYPGAIRSLVGAYLPAGWKATTEFPLWTRIYVDVPGWQSQYAHVFHATREEQRQLESELRDRQLGTAARHNRSIWLITQDYSGVSDTRHWFASHGYRLLLGQEYANDARIELWSRDEPAVAGRRVAWTMPGCRTRSGLSRRQARQAGFSIREARTVAASGGFPFTRNAENGWAGGARAESDREDLRAHSGSQKHQPSAGARAGAGAPRPQRIGKDHAA